MTWTLVESARDRSTYTAPVPGGMLVLVVVTEDGEGRTATMVFVPMPGGAK